MIHYFNPGHEAAVLNASPFYTPPANVVKMQEDLCFLPAWYADTGDTILLSNNSNSDFVSFLTHYLNFQVRTATLETLDICNEEIALWGISPQAIHLFSKLNQQHNLKLQIPVWNDSYTYLNSRNAAKDCLIQVCNSMPSISTEIIPRFFDSLVQIENTVNSSPIPLLAKAPYSSSGRGLLWLPMGKITRAEAQILNGILKKQGNVSIEARLDKQLDLAMEFMADGNGSVCFEGYSLFTTNNKGAYQGNYLISQECIHNQISKMIGSDIIEDAKLSLIDILSKKYAPTYKGCLGVDMLAYKDTNGQYKLHPCLEINMRYNMGYLSVKLYDKYVHPTSSGRFLIDFSPVEGEVFDRHTKMQKEHPPSFEDNRITSGYLPLCPVSQKSKYWAYILIDCYKPFS